MATRKTRTQIRLLRLAARGDLGERAIVLKLEPFVDARLMDEAVRTAFVAKWPGLLGLVRDGIASAVRNGGQAPPSRPRHSSRA